MAFTFKIRRDTTLNWQNANPILCSGEMGYDNELKVLKIGDGVTSWNDLLPLTTTISNAADNRILTSDGTSNSANAESNLTFDGTILDVNGEVDSIGLVTEYIKMSTSGSSIPRTPGTLVWNNTEGTLDLSMLGGNVTQQIGLEQFYRVTNQNGYTIENGKPVRAVGAVGNSGQIKVSYGTSDITVEPQHFMGIATEDIPSGESGFITCFGLVRHIDTTGGLYGESWQDGDILYISPTISGGLTKNTPQAPAHSIVMAMVIKAHSNGSLFVRPTFTHSFQMMSDVNGTALTQDGQFAVWDNTNKYFDFTKTIVETLGNDNTTVPTSLAVQNALVNSGAGTSGTSGQSSTAGTSGESATAGTSGQSSTAGTSGQSSTAGTSGESATAGTSGESATAGTSGQSSTAGTSGQSSTAGTSGQSSTAGTSGQSSTAGTSGQSSTAGTSGQSSTAGTSGQSSTAGTSGQSSTAGTSGQSSTAGTSGQSSTAGTSGQSSTAGTSGQSSTAGTSGQSSTAGTSGQSSTAGTSGQSSTAGTSGQNATAGTSGQSATAGTSGQSSTAGTSGQTSTAGTSGQTSTAGTSGQSSTAGTSGANGSVETLNTSISNLTGSGILATETVNSNSVGVGCLLYMSGSGLAEANASTSTTVPSYALAITAGTGSQTVLLQGYFRNNSWSFTKGDILYVGTSLGTVTNVQPSASGEQSQVVGIAIASNIIYFKPELTVLEIL